MNTTLLTAPSDRTCDSCAAPIAQGARAAWSPGVGRIECLECSEAESAASLIVASVARTRSTRGESLHVAPVVEEIADPADAIEIATETATEIGAETVTEIDDEIDDDATPVNGLRRPPLAAPDAETMSTDAPPAPDCGSACDQIAPLVPPTHEPLVEQAMPAPMPPTPATTHAFADVPTPAGVVDPQVAPAEPELVPPAPSEPMQAVPSLPTLPGPAVAPTSPAPATAATPGSVTLRNRKIPRARAGIDRLVIAPSGVWVLDDRDEDGKIVLVSDRRRPEPKLHVDGKDRSKMLRKADVAAQAVLGQLARIGQSHVPVRRVFCFSRGLPVGPANERIVGSVAILSQTEFDAAVAAGGPLDSETIARLADHLGSSFPAA